MMTHRKNKFDKWMKGCIFYFWSKKCKLNIRCQQVRFCCCAVCSKSSIQFMYQVENIRISHFCNLKGQAFVVVDIKYLWHTSDPLQVLPLLIICRLYTQLTCSSCLPSSFSVRSIVSNMTPLDDCTGGCRDLSGL